MNARLRDRLAAAVSIALLAALSLFTLYLAQRAARDRERPAAAAPAAGEPDYFVDRMALLTMNDAGAPAYRLQAGSLIHFPADDSTQFEAPVMVSLDPSRPRVTVTADRGQLLNWASRRDQEVQLSGRVNVVREARKDSAELVAVTDFAIVLPNADIVRTDRPITITHGPHRLQGVGMELDNKARQLRLDSKVRATFEPPSR